MDLCILAVDLKKKKKESGLSHGKQSHNLTFGSQCDLHVTLRKAFSCQIKTTDVNALQPKFDIELFAYYPLIRSTPTEKKNQ